MSFYHDLEKGLLEAIMMEKGELEIKEKKGMPAPTFYVPDMNENSAESKQDIMKE